MGDAPEAEKTEEPAEVAKTPDEPEKVPEEPPPPGDPKKEWPLAIAIMVFLALMSWAFVSMLRTG